MKMLRHSFAHELLCALDMRLAAQVQLWARALRDGVRDLADGGR
jgi:hypothetical protein